MLRPNMKLRLTILALMAAAGCLRADDDKALRVSAAASLADVLKEIHQIYQENGGRRVRLNTGASSVLARQIAEGAPADVFISADLAKMDDLEKKGLIDVSTRESQLSNSLVVIVRADNAVSLASGRDLLRMRRIALADPKAVPAGVYAKQWFEKLGIWRRIEPKVVATGDVRAALAAVESGNLDAGVVYKTDAAISKKVRIAHEVPANEAPPIIYPMAVLKGAADAAEARRYLAFLDSAAAVGIFGKHGFIVLPEAAKPASE